MNRAQVIAICVALSVGGFVYPRLSGPSLSGVARIAEATARDRSTRLAEAYEGLADRIDSSEFANADELSKATAAAVTEATDGVGDALANNAADTLPDGDIADREIVSGWYRAVAKGFRRAGQ